MNTVKMPGFTAEAAVSQTIGHYRAMAPTTTAMTAAALMPALPVNDEPQWVDCNKFYNAWVCRECGATGPESIKCCSGDNCAVIDKNPGLRRPPQPILPRPGKGEFTF